MKFVCKKSDLIYGVQIVANAVSSRSTLPILSNILLETEKNTLHLSATDLEVSIQCRVPAEVAIMGSVTLPAKRFMEIVRELPDNNVDISLSENMVTTLICEKSVFKLNSLGKEEFPNLPKAKPEKGLTLPQSAMQDFIRKTLFSVSVDETRYVLNGVLLQTDEQRLRLVSTDGHRLSMILHQLEKPPAQKYNHIIPAKAMQELLKILGTEGEVNIQLNENQMLFSTAHAMLLSRLIEGQFPNYEQVVPQKSDKAMQCSTAHLLAATRRVALMASDKSNSVKYSLYPNKLTITANTPEIGEAQEEMDIDYQGENIVVAFNAKYMIDVLKNLGSDDCRIELTASLNPGLIKPKESKDEYVCIIMPMRI